MTVPAMSIALKTPIVLKTPKAITAKSVTKHFVLDSTASLYRLLFKRSELPAFTALTDVSIDVPRGSFVGLLGRNGAGKSSLLRTIGGIHAPDQGVINVNGDMAALYELGITGNDHLTGREFAERWFTMFGSGTVNQREIIAEVHDFSELEDAFARPIRTYSSGMRARLYFAVATATQASVYVIDEMLAVGDEYFQNKCWRRLRARLGQGASGLLATHDWTAIMKLCQTCHILGGGKIVASGPTPDVVRNYLGNSTTAFDTGAKFSADLPDQFTGQSGEDLVINVEIDVTEPGDVQFGIAVEKFLVGYGWEHILHGPPKSVATTLGHHRVEARFPKLRLPAGDYALALFCVLVTPEGQRRVTDARGWTYGNGLQLVVGGRASAGTVLCPATLAWAANSSAQLPASPA
jgi:lipopolysaccharide transport system ATP-binding protein